MMIVSAPATKVVQAMNLLPQSQGRAMGDFVTRGLQMRMAKREQEQREDEPNEMGHTSATGNQL